jgi:hypothetical protein
VLAVFVSMQQPAIELETTLNIAVKGQLPVIQDACPAADRPYRIR